MLYDETVVRANIRNREGKRVFFLGHGDQLTSGARDFLTRERIPILPAEQAKITRYRLENGGYLEEKPEHMTHLHGDVLVEKTHPRIAFRGAMDTLEARLLLCGSMAHGQAARELAEILDFARSLIRCDVLEETVKLDKLCGLTESELRLRSHRPQEFYGQPHFMPGFSDSPLLLQLNLCRCAARAAELAAARAFCGGAGTGRTDILQALNRMSSMLWILMIREKAGKL